MGVLGSLIRSFRHLNIDSSPLRSLVIKEIEIFQENLKNQVSSITSERIELESMLRCLNDRLNEPKTPTKFDGSRTILRGADQTVCTFRLTEIVSQKVQTVWSRYLNIVLAPSNFVSVFYSLRRSFRHLSQVFSSIR